MNRKNVIKKFSLWFNKLPEEEQRNLYDVLCLLRGPDSENYTLKKTMTSRIRATLGLNGDIFTACCITHDPFEHLEKLRVDLENYRTTDFHYFAHCLMVLDYLVEVGYIKSEETAA